jgi:hypothetical protein
MHLSIRPTILVLASTLIAAAASQADAPRPWFLVRIYRGTQAGPAGAVGLRTMSASDCQPNGRSPAPPQEAVALKFLRIYAAKVGADALVKVSCNSGPVKGCVSAVTCVGEAVQLPKSTLISK